MGRDFEVPPSPNLCRRNSCQRSGAQNPIRPGLGHCQGWSTHGLFQCLTTFIVKNLFLVTHLNLYSFNLIYHPLDHWASLHLSPNQHAGRHHGKALGAHQFLPVTILSQIQGFNHPQAPRSDGDAGELHLNLHRLSHSFHTAIYTPVPPFSAGCCGVLQPS